MAKDWTPSSWRAKPIEQVPAYPDLAALAETEKRLPPFRRWFLQVRRAS